MGAETERAGSPTESVARFPRAAAVWALYATALAPLVFSSRTIFPYVVPRAVFFRALVAAAAAVALYLLATRRSSLGRRRDPFLLTLGAFVAVQLVAALLGAAPWRSLFGDLERMGGVIAWIHLLAFYAALRALLGDRELMAFLWVTAAAATAVGLVAILQMLGVTVGILPGTGAARAFGTLGNPGYLAIYALFGMAVAALLGLRSESGSGRALAAAAALVNGSTLVLTWTRAAVAGVGAGLVLGVVAYAAMAGPGRRRRWSLAGAVGLLLLGAVAAWGLWSSAADGFRGAERVANVSHIERSLGFRYSAWRAGARAVADRPLTGLGPENYRLAFDWHLRPDRFEPTRTHYTRAHNDLVESLVAGGIPGGLAWLALWAALFWSLHAARREGELGAGETALLSGTFAAYLVYLLFWFHDQNSFPILLALAAFVSRRDGGPWLDPAAAPLRVRSGAGRLGIGVAVALVAVVDVAYHGRLLGSAHHLLKAAEVRQLEDRIAHYDRALELRPAGAEEVVTELVDFARQLPGAVGRIERGSPAAAAVDGALERTRRALTAQLARDPRNPRLQRDAGRLYVMSYQWDRNPAHLDSAAARLGEAIDLAPGRLNYRHMLSEMHLMAGQPAEAVQVLEEGLAAYDAYADTYYFLAKALLVGGALEESAAALIRSYELGYRERNPTVRQVLVRELRARGANETVARIREARRAPR